ncbi:MAG: ABC transporter substrate-binding protein [Actinobacteria bacterium]|nr:ABC transporter substrate-binding protein [Actinomycetota bacterium]
MSRRLAAGIVALLLSALLAACGGSDGSSGGTSETAAAGPEPAEVSIALDWTPNTNHIGIYVADRLGYYAEEGLTVRILPYAQTPAETLVANGEADFGFSFSNGIAFSRAAGLDVVQVFANIAKQQYLIAYRADDPDISSPKDLVGKTYAGFGTPSEESEVATVIEGDGGAGDFRTVVLDTAAYEAVYGGRADFTISAITWEGVEAEVSGKPMKYFDPADYGYPESYSSTIISSNAWLTANGDVARRFLAATQRGYRYAQDDPEAAAQLLMDANPQTLKNPEVVRRSAELLAEEGYYGGEAGAIGLIDEGLVTTFYDFLFDRQLLVDADGKPLAERPDWSQAYTNAYVPSSSGG